MIDQRTQSYATIQPYFNSYVKTILSGSEIEKTVDDSFKDIMSDIEQFQANGSNWEFDTIITTYVNTNKYQPLKGSSYLKAPARVQNIKAIVTIQNTDNECFRWCVLAHLHKIDGKNNPNRVDHYKNIKMN